jgi:hypothetical protein
MLTTLKMKGATGSHSSRHIATYQHKGRLDQCRRPQNAGGWKWLPAKARHRKQQKGPQPLADPRPIAHSSIYARPCPSLTVPAPVCTL